MASRQKAVPWDPPASQLPEEWSSPAPDIPACRKAGMETSYWPLPLNKACTWLRPTRNPAVKGYQRADRGRTAIREPNGGARDGDALFSASRRGASRDSSQLARAAGARV